MANAHVRHVAIISNSTVHSKPLLSMYVVCCTSFIPSFNSATALNRYRTLFFSGPCMNTHEP